MKINVDRLATLAGLSGGRSTLTEGRLPPAAKPKKSGGGRLPKAAAPKKEEKKEDLDEIIEIDEVMLVQELRRAKKQLQESRRVNREAEAAALQEAQLKKIIESEVSNVLRDLNLSSGWIYGNNKPRASKKGFVHQGAFLKGLGFK